MHLLFLDESGKPEDRMFAIGGHRIAAAEWPVLRDRITQTYARCNWPVDKELKWHGIRSGEVPPETADAVFASLYGSEITCYAVMLRPLAGREAFPRFFETPEDTYATGLMFLAERFQRFLTRADSYGVIVLDSRRREVDDRLRRFFEGLQREGTPFMELDRIVDSILLGPSHFSLGLQVADLIVASTLAAKRGQGDATRWHKQLRPRFATHPDTGVVEGVGLVEFPKRSHGEESMPSKLFSA